MPAKRSPFDYRQIAGFYFAAGTVVRGNLNEQEDVVIDGSLEGNVSTTGFCEITENGSLKGNLAARNATILGTIEGEMTLQESFVVKKSAHIQGYVVTPRISIENGAIINARIKQPSRKTGLADHE